MAQFRRQPRDSALLDQFRSPEKATLDYSQHDSFSKKRRLIIDRHELSLHLEMDDTETGDQVVAEFNLAEAEEISAAIDRVCRNIRMKRV
jgi:hypothetical protein